MTAREVLRLSANELERSVRDHRRLLARALEGGDHAEVETCLRLSCPHRKMLRETLAEAVSVLEATRKSFKSKQLEGLRKKLMRVQAEDA
jgi:hypothetical protein